MQDPLDSPAPPRDAATVVVIRDGQGGVELFCVERHARSGFMGGALVFPGGKVDPVDHAEIWASRATSPAGRAAALAASPSTARAFAIAALREALEEAAILPVVGDTVRTQALLEMRAELSAPGAPSLSTLLERHGLILDVARLEGLSRWITPVVEPKRFDTRFYVLALPPEQHGVHDDHETTRSFWGTPEDILSRWRAGEVQLAPPTSFTVGLFCGARDWLEALAVARRQSLAPVQPCFVSDGQDMVLALPGDPLYPDPEAAPVLAGTSRFVLEDGRFIAAKA